jgi:two-component system, NarL family, nitrate/nitrite response regulator NarL
MSDNAQVAICDPSEIARLGIARALQMEGLKVIGTAGDAAGGAALLARKPDVLLVDVSCPGFEDLILEAVRQGAIAIGTGVEAGDDRAFAGLVAGASGYLTKDLPARSWAGAVRAGLRGEAPMSRAMTARLVAAYRSRAARAPLALMPSESRLTKREWEILGRVAAGETNRAVAEELCISVETVRTHVSSILTKLEAPNRSAAAVKYHQLVSVI